LCGFLNEGQLFIGGQILSGLFFNLFLFEGDLFTVLLPFEEALNDGFHTLVLPVLEEPAFEAVCYFSEHPLADLSLEGVLLNRFDF
jgi:hypothetical protein